MWKLITDCGKQLTIHSRVREKNENYLKLYEIVEVEFDKYKLKLIEKNNIVAAEEGRPVITCLQLKQYAFEVEQKG
ncbi:MAG TPA: hypothetical protein VMU83_08230 [Hanamia sp.]|nr:hypothetical protein [Hanamia sp.]